LDLLAAVKLRISASAVKTAAGKVLFSNSMGWCSSPQAPDGTFTKAQGDCNWPFALFKVSSSSLPSLTATQPTGADPWNRAHRALGIVGRRLPKIALGRRISSDRLMPGIVIPDILSM
jgi:hypothetical protein